jgi:hypothetical protein
MSDSPGLSAKQARAIAALTTCRTLDAAAKAAQCNPSTLRRWLAKDPAFQAAWREARTAMVEQAVAQAQRSAEAGALVLHTVMLRSTSDFARIAAAKALLDISVHWLERGELEAKMQDLLAQMEALRHAQERLP